MARRAHRVRWLLPVGSFAAGLASFFLVERQAELARWLTAALFAGWLWLLFDGLLGRWLSRWLPEHIPRLATRFGAQSLHQETLFFVLPFFIATTTWRSGQILFTGTLVLAAAASIIDPIYVGFIGSRRWLFLGFHAFALFVALLVALPIVLGLTSGESLAAATVAMMIFALPSLAGVIDVRRTRRWALLVLVTLAVGAFAWTSRSWIPPATLRVTDAAITTVMHEDQRDPGRDLSSIPASRLQQGLYAYTAIKAPLGLRQPVVHVWRHQGEVIDRIRLQIVGGREQGYRAWSHKTSFPANPRGEWQVLVKTLDGQLIGVLRFEVV